MGNDPKIGKEEEMQSVDRSTVWLALVDVRVVPVVITLGQRKIREVIGRILNLTPIGRFCSCQEKR